MIDVCTMILITTQTLQLCYSENICRPSAYGTKQVCTGVYSKPCASLEPTYECVRPDGVKYFWNGRDGR